MELYLEELLLKGPTEEQSLVPPEHGCLFVMETPAFLRLYTAPCELEPEERRRLVCLNKPSKEAFHTASLLGLPLYGPLGPPTVATPVSDSLKTSHSSLEEPKSLTEPTTPVTVSARPALPAFPFHPVLSPTIASHLPQK